MDDRATVTNTEEAPVVLEEATDAVVVVKRRRRRWPWILAVVVAGALVAVWALTRNGTTAADAEPVARVNTGVVVQTDLVEITTYAGTLGRVEGDPVTSGRQGTVTAAAEPGDVVGQGDVLFEIDGEPVVLLLGAAPAYRTIAASEGTVSLASTSAGTLTRIASTGDALALGDVAYVLGNTPTFVMYGDTPAWRTLSEGVDEGPDVRQLEQSLVDLGYDPDATVSIDEDFTGNTEAMVERWQEDVGIEEDGVVSLGEVVFVAGPTEVMAVPAELGQAVNNGQAVISVGDGEATSGDDVGQLELALADLGFDPGSVDGTYDEATGIAIREWQASVGSDVDGIVDLGEVVFAPAPIRISDRLAPVGAGVGVGTAVLAATGADIVVTVDLPAADQGLVAAGAAVTIELPDDTQTPGTVDAVATIATVGQTGEAVFEVTISLDDPTAASGLDEAPVDVDVITDQVDDAMAVPVTALVALAEGGYAVEVVDENGGTRLVGVDPGFYAEGLVEVGSDGLSVGDQVVLP